MVEGKDYTVIDNVTKYYFGNWPNGISEKSVLTGGVYPQDDSWKITSNGMTVGWESITYIYTNDYIYINSLGTCKETEDPIKKAPVAKILRLVRAMHLCHDGNAESN